MMLRWCVLMVCLVVAFTASGCVADDSDQTVSVDTKKEEVCVASDGQPCPEDSTSAGSEDHGKAGEDGDKQESEGPTFRSKFHFTTEPVPRYHYTDPKVWESFKNQVPAIIYGNPVFKTDVPWDITYMASRVQPDVKWNAVVSPDGPVFHDFDDDANYANYKWVRPYEKAKMPFRDFVKIHEEVTRADNGSRAYLQSYLREERMGQAVYRVDYPFINKVRSIYGWGGSGNNIMLLAMKDSVTPCHYDYDENLFQQVFGHKRFVLFPPEDYGKIYPFPAHHAMDRYTQVDFENPNLERFPRFQELKVGQEAVLGPGDVLYVPTMWWHVVEASREGDSMSVAFRYNPKETAYYSHYDTTMSLSAQPQRDGRVIYHKDINVEDPVTGKSWNIRKPDPQTALVHLRRHIENFIAEATGSYRKVPEMLHELLDGRFDGLEFSKEDPI